MSLLTKAHQGLPHAVGSHGLAALGGREKLKPWFGKFPLGRVGNIPQVVHSFGMRMQGGRCVSHCVKLGVF